MAFAVSASALATNSRNIFPLIQNVPGRELQNLDGIWKYILDLYELGYYNYRMNEDPTVGSEGSANRDLVEYNFIGSVALCAGDWNTQRSSCSISKAIYGIGVSECSRAGSGVSYISTQLTTNVRSI